VGTALFQKCAQLILHCGTLVSKSNLEPKQMNCIYLWVCLQWQTLPHRPAICLCKTCRCHKCRVTK